MKAAALLVLLVSLTVVSAKIYFQESFDDTYKDRWVVSDWKKSDGTAGEWKHTAGEWYGDKTEDMGIQTGQDARFFAISAKLPTPFSNKGKDLVVQFSAKHTQKIDCGGGYIKLLPSTTDQAKFSGDAPYYIMFGPDVCGTTTKKTHVIVTYKEKNHLIKKEVRCETDQLTHVYTLILHPDQTYEVRIDGSKVQSGSLLEDWDFLPAKMIKDPKAAKPADWVDAEFIDDPNDHKPADWDAIPKQIPDPDAEKPDDWNEETDGKWEAPMIDNPEYKGEWKAKQIPNPAYKGKWVHPEVPNPDYVEDKEIYAFSDIGVVGFELWQVKAGTIFDNILVADSVADADALLDSTYKKHKDGEKSMFDALEKQKQEAEEAERKKREAEEKKKADEEKKKEDDDDEEEEDEEEEKKPAAAAAGASDEKKKEKEDL